jgi:hypothetical protein
MNLILSTPAVPPAETPRSIPQAAFEQAAANPDPTETWLLVVTGISSATFLANLICPSPHPHATYWIVLFLQAAFLLVLTAAAGAAGIFVPWFFLKIKPPFPFASLAKKAALAWVFLPGIILLYHRHSPWMFPVLAVAAIAIAFNIRRLVPAAESLPSNLASETRDLPSKLPRNLQTYLPSLNGLPGSDSRPLRAFFLAACLQGALMAAVAEWFFFAAILLSVSLFLLVWQWSAFDSAATGRFANKQSATLLYTLAFFLTAFLLIPSASGGAPGAGGTGRAPRTPPTFAHGPTATSNNDYIGIILWSPPVKKQALPPVPRPHSFASGAAAKPLIIPFDGQYWYFKAPSVRPGPHAHVARGRPTDVTVRSSDFAPLLMEAHQNLNSPIDLACCREIELAITNADTRPGKISLGLILTDAISPDKPSRNLGSRPIPSSEPATIPLDRAPIHEVLRFPIPRSSTTHRFNEITVIYLPTPERARGAAKVSIQSFALIPR